MTFVAHRSDLNLAIKLEPGKLFVAKELRYHRSFSMYSTSGSTVELSVKLIDFVNLSTDINWHGYSELWMEIVLIWTHVVHKFEIV
jgi:hypothetical protein